MVVGNLACVTSGACIVVPGESFDPHDALSAVAAERCTSLYGVPTMFAAELEQLELEDFDLTSLRTGIMGGAPCPTELMKQVRSRLHMPEVTIACGMTETSPVSTQTSIDDPVRKRVTTVGRLHPHVEIKVIDPQHRSDRAARHARRAVHPGLLGDARLLEAAGQDGRGDRRRGLDAHR